MIGEFQSTLPQGERPRAIRKIVKTFDISIHAPARGATLMTLLRLTLMPEFQSTLPQGERPMAQLIKRKKKGFQSTLPQGERPWVITMIALIVTFQSTLPQGERRRSLLMITAEMLFQSTLPQGERHHAQVMRGGKGVFQSTLPQGERRQFFDRCCELQDFNPRSRKGSDVPPVKDGEGDGGISIHAPARGATPLDRLDKNSILISIHAPARGATRTISSRT